MTLLTCAALGILFSLSNQEILASTQNTLKKQVQKSLDDIEWEDGSWDVDSDFYNLDGGIYLSIYTESGDFLYGRIWIRLFQTASFRHCLTGKSNGIFLISHT